MARKEPTKLSPVAWAGLVTILLIVSLAVTSNHATSPFQWQSSRRQLRDNAQHHALMEQQDAERLTPAQLAQLNRLRARFLQEELDAVAEAPSPDAGLDEGAVAGEGSPTGPSDVGASAGDTSAADDGVGSSITPDTTEAPSRSRRRSPPAPLRYGWAGSTTAGDANSDATASDATATVVPIPKVAASTAKAPAAAKSATKAPAVAPSAATRRRPVAGATAAAEDPTTETPAANLPQPTLTPYVVPSTAAAKTAATPAVAPTATVAKPAVVAPAAVADTTLPAAATPAKPAAATPVAAPVAVTVPAAVKPAATAPVAAPVTVTVPAAVKPAATAPAAAPVAVTVPAAVIPAAADPAIATGPAGTGAAATGPGAAGAAVLPGPLPAAAQPGSLPNPVGPAATNATVVPSNTAGLLRTPFPTRAPIPAQPLRIAIWDMRPETLCILALTPERPKVLAAQVRALPAHHGAHLQAAPTARHGALPVPRTARQTAHLGALPARTTALHGALHLPGALLPITVAGMVAVAVAVAEDGEVLEGEDRGVPVVGAVPAVAVPAAGDPAVAVQGVPGDAVTFRPLIYGTNQKIQCKLV
ncbi:g5000 [Coccomyxa elongata]